MARDQDPLGLEVPRFKVDFASGRQELFCFPERSNSISEISIKKKKGRGCLDAVRN